MVLLLFCNAVFLWVALPAALALKILAAIALFLLYIWLNVWPGGGRGLPGKLRQLGQGCELLLTASLCTVLDVALGLVVGLAPLYRFTWQVWVLGGVFGLAALWLPLVNGSIRVFATSGQLSVTRRVLLICLCWWPVVNLAVFFIAWPVAHREYRFMREGHLRNRQRAAQRICATRYPLLLVHGIFFRDWKQMNYWGRIPAALEANGARIFYGQQQSSASVPTSAGELKAQILQVVEQTGCGKVNIIAHSKGGLDARYAISCLGMDGYVASLTTVNTPHRGCRFARQALDNLPAGMVSMVDRNYNKIFTRLGDKQPDFYSGVSELTDNTCERLNQEMPDREGVLYQSIGSRMKSAKSAIFPLNLGFTIIDAIDKDNDGLVATTSMPWGAFTMVEPAGKMGISHADMIDLTRRDVPGFDVCEMYVNVVRRLGEQGM